MKMTVVPIAIAIVVISIPIAITITIAIAIAMNWCYRPRTAGPSDVAVVGTILVLIAIAIEL